MSPPDHALLVWLFGYIETLGLLSAALVRIEQGSPRESAWQRFFLIQLGVVGTATLVSLNLHPGYWLSCGTALSLMVLAAVWDPRRTGLTTTW